jgi:hypothetical protein
MYRLKMKVCDIQLRRSRTAGGNVIKNVTLSGFEFIFSTLMAIVIAPLFGVNNPERMKLL